MDLSIVFVAHVSMKQSLWFKDMMFGLKIWCQQAESGHEGVQIVWPELYKQCI